jgi:UDP-3-O-[3-hydroxymyristoyl] glucosamine N-acyltransferase
VDPGEKTVIKLDHPYTAFARLLQHFAPQPPRPFSGISEQAFVSDEAVIAPGAAIGPGAYIGPGTTVGENTVIWPGVSIGPSCTIGNNCIIHANVSIYYHCVVGSNCILHSSCVIGADGFGFAPDGEQYVKIPQLGNVVIEDDVEIGANSTIDRAAMGSTIIHRGTKIDNLVMVAHNCEIGENTLLISQVGISGSTRLGKHVILAGQSGICGHLEIGDFVQVGAQSGVTKNLEGNKTFLGSPAIPVQESKRLISHIHRLPRLHKRIKELEKKLADLTEERSSSGEDERK